MLTEIEQETARLAAEKLISRPEFFLNVQGLVSSLIVKNIQTLHHDELIRTRVKAELNSALLSIKERVEAKTEEIYQHQVNRRVETLVNSLNLADLVRGEARREAKRLLGVKLGPFVDGIFQKLGL